MRTAESFGMPAPKEVWPDVGDIVATCMKAEKYKSPKKGTQGVKLIFDTPDCQYHFSDVAWVTMKTVDRLNMVAQRLCGLPKDAQVPDEAAAAAGFFAKYILENAAGKQVLLTVETEGGTYMDERGETRERTRKKVAYAGYNRVGEEGAEVAPPMGTPVEDDSIPF